MRGGGQAPAPFLFSGAGILEREGLAVVDGKTISDAWMVLNGVEAAAGQYPREPHLIVADAMIEDADAMLRSEGCPIEIATYHRALERISYAPRGATRVPDYGRIVGGVGRRLAMYRSPSTPVVEREFLLAFLRSLGDQVRADPRASG